MCLLILITWFLSQSVMYTVGTGHAKCTLDSSTNVTEFTRASIIHNLIDNAKNLLEDAKKYALKSSCPIAEPYCDKPMDCADIYEKESSRISGVNKIWPRSRVSSGPISVYCDMEDDGGGWTVIQKRGDFNSHQNYFFQDWAAYKKGFGDLLQDFWLGNDNIFALTNQKLHKVKFSLSDWEGNKTYAAYDEFWIADELHKYTMHVNGYRGTAGDSFSYTNGIPFSTKDEDNDPDERNCADKFKGAWWYTTCHYSNLNGLYFKGQTVPYGEGVVWAKFRGFLHSLKDTTIKIRPNDFKDGLAVNKPH